MEDFPEPANLRFLRRLVTVLTTVMIGGLLIVIVLLVTQLTRRPSVLPEEITLPDGETATAYTQGADWYAIVTASNKIMIFDRSTGALRQTVAITSP